LPINATSDLKGSVAIITEKMVSQQEMEWRSARGAEDRLRQEASLKDLRDAQVPGAELDHCGGEVFLNVSAASASCA